MADEKDFRKSFIGVRDKLSRHHAMSIEESQQLHRSLIYACLKSLGKKTVKFERDFSSISGFQILPESINNEITQLLKSARRFCSHPAVITSLLELMPEDDNSRKKTGSYYTPLTLAKFMAMRLIEEYLNNSPDSPGAYNILDPSTGAGIFLDAVYTELVVRGWFPREILDLLYGVDKNYLALEMTSEMLKTKAWGKKIKPNHLMAGDFLLDDLDHPPDGYGMIIGNPPYISYYSRGAQDDLDQIKSRLKSRYGEIAGGSLNTFLHFTVRSIELLCHGGLLCFIVPDKLLWNSRYKKAREYILSEASPRKIYHAGENVFPGATVGNVIIMLEKGRKADQECMIMDVNFSDGNGVEIGKSKTVKPDSFLNDREFRFLVKDQIVSQMEQNAVPLGEIAHIRDGINPGFRKFRDRILSDKKLNSEYKSLIEGVDISPFSLKIRKKFIHYAPEIVSVEMRNRGVSFREEWIFSSKAKLVNRQTADRLVFALDEGCHYSLNSVHNTLIRDEFPTELTEILNIRASDIKVKKEMLLYLMGILNSRLMNYYHRSVTGETAKNFPQVHIADLKWLPVRFTDIGMFKDVVRISNRLHRTACVDRKDLEELDRLIFALYGIGKNAREKVIQDTGNEWRLSKSHTRGDTSD